MNCKDIDIKISTSEMSQIVECVEIKYKHRILVLESDLDTYKMQISNLLKDKAKLNIVE